MPKEKKNIEGRFTQQQSHSPKTENRTPKYGVAKDVPEPSDDAEDRDIFSKQVSTQTTLDDL